jgi:hypothetical protein
VKEFAWLLGGVVTLFLLGVSLQRSVQADEDASVALIVVLIVLGAYSWRRLVILLLLYLSVFAGLKFFRWWEERSIRRATNTFEEDDYQ